MNEHIINDAGLRFAAVPAARGSTRKLILHHAAGSGSVEAIHAFHLARGWHGIGYHYYIRRDGDIWRGREESAVGAHTVGHNGSSIAICFEGNFQTETMGQAQRAAGLWLIGDILSRYPGLTVSGHRDHDSTACPGANFPAELLNYKEAEIMSISEFIDSLTDEQAYAIIEKAQRHAETLPLPAWAEEEYSAAVSAGITDGEGPMRLMPRWQGAVMAMRR